MLNAASVKKLAGVNPALVKLVERADQISKQPFQIVQGNRTAAYQHSLWLQGRGKPGPIVTWKDGYKKKSNHQGGNAIDFAALVNGKISWSDKLYQPIADAFAQASKELGIGIIRGIDWHVKDLGHIELAPGGPKAKAPAAGIGWTMSDIQTALNKHGFDPGTVDGILGAKTRAALTAFQRQRGLPETGGTNKETLDELAKKPNAPLPMMSLLAASPVLGEPVRDAEWAIGFLQSLGWSRLEAVAIAANLVWESGGRNGNIVWSAHGDKGKDGEYHSHGAPQWNDRAKYQRWQKYQAFAKSQSKDWTDAETQLRYLDKELNTTERGPAKKLKAATTLRDAVAAAITFWRPSIPHADKRQAIAEVLNQEVAHV